MEYPNVKSKENIPMEYLNGSPEPQVHLPIIQRLAERTDGMQKYLDGVNRMVVYSEELVYPTEVFLILSKYVKDVNSDCMNLYGMVQVQV